jgi:outer membrane protein OmpA-like peptidoglycan-associated protein
MHLDPFSSPGAVKSRSSDEIFVKSKHGGLGRRAAPLEPLEPMEIPEAEAAPEPEKKPLTVVLSNPTWEEIKVGFNQETPISAQLELPKEHAHKTKVTFELFAKTPQGPERISQGEGVAKDGKALCKIPVYIPQFKDEDGNLMPKVEYYFVAKHSEAKPLDGSKAPKLVDGMAERLIETHILPDITFATGKSVLHPKHAEALKDMCSRIEAWREKNPDGKLAVFGHADAVGKENDNKPLSERRAKSVYAFLIKDAAAWGDLDKEEKWDLASIQDLLKHLGHDPGAADGKDGPKTQAAVKAFQTDKGLPADGKAGAQTRVALYQAFMDKGNGLILKLKDFDDIKGGPTAGCGEYNLKEKTQGACETNRRVTVALLKSNKNFPINYPCAKGDVGPCKKQAARKGDRRTAGFGCFFYDGLVVENENGGTQSGVVLKSAYAHEQLTKLATDLSETNFIIMLLPIFGDDVPIAAYSRLYRALSDGALPPPEIDVLMEGQGGLDGLEGHSAGFNSGSKKVLISEPLAKASASEEEKRQILFIALVEEYGHYIDWTLRNEYSTVGGDAQGDEGAIYSYRMAFLDVFASDELHFADLESDAYTGLLSLDVAGARAGAEKYANVEEQILDGKNGEIEYFGAGRGHAGEPGSYGHQSIEEALVRSKFKKTEDLHRIYFGNWLRDFSQFVDPAIIRPSDAALAKLQAKYKDKAPALDTNGLSRRAITSLVGILAWKEFSKENVPFSLKAKALLTGPGGMDLLGGYRPEEHIDNPFTTDTTDASLVDPVFAKPPTASQLDLNPLTGVKNYIATHTPGQSFPTAVEYLEGRFQKAMAAGYTDDGLRYFGEGLHVLEDYFSHSNFIEVSFIKLGYPKTVPWVTFPARTKRIPLVTGCFGRTDVLASVGPKVANLIPHEVEDYSLIKPGERTPTDQTILIVLEDLKQAQKADTTQKNQSYQGLNAATSLDFYNKYLGLRDLVNSGKADWKAEWLFKSMHYGMQGFLVATSFATYLLFANASHLVDDAQTLTTKDIGLNPTHSQLAKDHDVHHFHEIAAKVAKMAVEDVGKAMHNHWNGPDKSADPIAVAKSYIQHPLDHKHADIDALLREFAVSHPVNMKRAESWTVYEHVEHEGREKFAQAEKVLAEWGKRQKKWLKDLTEFFSGN